MAVSRSTPVGTMLENGYQSFVAFAEDPDVSFWEKTVQPLGLDGGEKIDITTMHNTTIKTYAAQALPGCTDATVTAAFDPQVLTQALALINVNGEVSNIFPDTSTWTSFGFLKSFVPDAMSNGAQPEASCTVVYTNVNASGAETAPVYAAGSP